MSYSGISVGFEWDMVPSNSYGNRIMYNHVYNIFYATGENCFRKHRAELYDSVLVEGNIMITNGNPVYGVRNELFLTQSGRNLVWDISGGSPKMCNNRDWDLQQWQEQTHLDAGSIVADPKIPGLAEFDFTLAENSPAFAMGFQPLPEKTAKP